MKYDVQQEILQWKKELGAKNKVLSDEEVRNVKQCFNETGTLPKNMYYEKDDDNYYTIEESEVFDKNVNDYILISICKNVSSTRKIAVFFVTLTILQIIGTFILLITK